MGNYLQNLFKGEPVNYVIVKDIASESAFDNAVKSTPPFDTVVHTASLFHYNITDNKKDLLDAAINGTKGILKTIHQSANPVKRIVITSSIAALSRSESPPKVYTGDI